MDERETVKKWVIVAKSCWCRIIKDRKYWDLLEITVLIFQKNVWQKENLYIADANATADTDIEMPMEGFPNKLDCVREKQFRRYNIKIMVIIM